VPPSEDRNAAARVESLLQAAGWRSGGDSGARYLREYTPGVERLRLDYALLIDERLVGAVEVQERMSEAVAHYADQLSRLLAGATDKPPVVYFSNGHETLVLPGPDEQPREVATFHSPAALAAASPLSGLAT
jgi:type I site-specific restriction endonuclease